MEKIFLWCSHVHFLKIGFNSVQQDKGVHDGRRLDDETQGDEIRPPAGNLTQAEPPSDVISVQSRPISVSGENTNELNLKIVIPSIHTFENKGDKEVEFVFNSLVENYEVFFACFL